MTVDVKLRAIMADMFDLKGGEIKNEFNLEDDLGIDSVSFVDLISTVENDFDIDIPDEDVDTIATFGDILAYVTKATA